MLLWKNSERMRFELQTGSIDPVVNDCAGSFVWFGTWHDKPMPTDEKLMESATQAEADVENINKRLDSRLVEGLPKPAVVQRVR